MSSEFVDIIQTTAIVAVALAMGYTFLLLRTALTGAVKLMSVIVERMRVIDEKVTSHESRIVALEQWRSNRA